MSMISASHGLVSHANDFQKMALQLFGPDTPIRALRMSDSRGMPLPIGFLDDVQGAPPSLEYIRWANLTRSVLYRLKRDGERVRVVECELPRGTKGNGFWTKNRVLDFEESV